MSNTLGIKQPDINPYLWAMWIANQSLSYTLGYTKDEQQIHGIDAQISEQQYTHLDKKI